MKLKQIILKYLCVGTMMVTGSATASTPASETDLPKSNQWDDKLAMAGSITIPYDASQLYFDEVQIQQKADALCDLYIDDMVNSQQRLNPLMGHNGYRAAVRNELPGAPVGYHCMWGQSTHLQNALNEMGDTITLIPDGAARRACTSFKSAMRDKYSAAKGFHNCIFEGRAYETDSMYNDALNKYLTRNNATRNDSASIQRRNQLTQKFAAQNFSVQSLNPGTIMIVPRPGYKNKFHAIMYLGQGRVENGAFIESVNGRSVYIAHNKENVGYMFTAYNTNNVFAADINSIAVQKYQMEVTQINTMSREQLIATLKDIKSDFNNVPTEQLRRIARTRYFTRWRNESDFTSPAKPQHILMQNLQNIRS